MTDVSAARTPRFPAAASLRSFWCLFVTQFQGAFSDNVFKFLVTFLIIARLPAGQRDRLVPLVGALFALPFILFSMAGGHLADRFSKRNIALAVKAAEIAIMGLAVLGFALNHIPLLLAVIFLMSAQSALFGPTKYGLLPELLPEQQLSWGNGLIGLGTFMSVIAGTIAAGALSNWLGQNQLGSGLLLVALAGAGTAAAAGIMRLPAADPAKKFRANFLEDLRAQFRLIRRDRVLLIAVLASNYIWFLGALLQPTLLFYGKDVLHLDDLHSACLQAALAVGIGVGSAASGYLSGKKIEIGFVPLGALGLAVFGALLARPGLSTAAFAVHLVLLGFWGGFYVVPVNALVQHRPDPGTKGGVIAASAFLSWIGILAASGLYYVLRNALGLEQTSVFLVGAGLSLLGTLAIAWVMPQSVLRLVLWFVTRTIYRIQVDGREHIPEKGGALFVCNHVSFVDALLLIAATDRPVRFMMFKGTYELPYVKPFARALGIIPISSEQRPRDMIHSLQTASEAIRAGDVVCIFAEGQITRIGQLLPFRRGLERIMKGVDAPVVPVALDGVWGSIFSFESKRFVWKLPHRLPYPVTVSFGAPLPGNTPALAVRQAVQELQAAAWHHRRRRMQPLSRAFVRTARRVPFRFAMADPQTPKVSFGGALTRTVFLARRLRRVWEGQRMVGLLLPPSVGGALANWAALLCGKVPVNLNYTLSEESLASCLRQCGLQSVLTSRAFLEKVKLSVPGNTLFLEDLAARPGFVEKLAAALGAWLLPAGLLERALRRHRRKAAAAGDREGGPPPHGGGRDGLDALATVIFSSGSTGEPKGVMLSHFNIGSNIEQLAQVFAFSGKDRMLGVLPFFHSFGFTGTLALPAVLGVGVVFHANPLDAKTVGQLVCDHEATFLLATPTFLQLYLRGCAPEQFGSLRFVAVGAEKLPERLASAFEERFGVRPFEAYGCTECAPAVTVNTSDFRAAGFRQVGGKRGKIGHPLPGVCVRIVDPVTFAPVPTGRPGLLLVRGPNVMLGYLGRPDKTAEVMRDGFYVTGDIAMLDEDGFLEITDRLSRFSKLGGEMVPHIKVEEKLHELAGAAEQTFVVTGVPDERKGERLVVLHKLPEEQLRLCLEKLAQSDLPNLWKPRPEAFVRVEAFPVLGSGKLDLRKVRELARARTATTAETPA
jgi:acyl-[acyl-carrier-protein]-phospholipid O-acyltransferase/long-chain-fatty-acid--[acyl-carrier-protein] ligase